MSQPSRSGRARSGRGAWVPGQWGAALGLSGEQSSPRPEATGGSQTTVTSRLSPLAAGWPRTGSWLVLLQRDCGAREEALLTSSETGCLEKKRQSKLPAPRPAPYRALCPSQFLLSTGSGQTKYRGPSLPGVTCSAARARLVWPHAVLTRSRLRGAGRQ